jgi:uridylate kinase
MSLVLIKLSGEYLFGNTTAASVSLLSSIIEQIKDLQNTHKFGFVVGGGNFFRASRQGVDLDLRQPVADSVGMLATVMNGLILQDFFKKAQVESEVLSAFEIPGVVKTISNRSVEMALSDDKVIVFVGGTGNPFFTTDTCAVLRALQIGSKLVWKATNVDGVYDADPRNNSTAKFLKQLSYTEFMAQNLKALDLTAISLAQQYSVKIRVFNIFAENALKRAASDLDFGSTIE